MMFPIENNETFLLFFHGLDSSCETSNTRVSSASRNFVKRSIIAIIL